MTTDRGPTGLAALLLAALLASAAVAPAQPYAADGGFDRPREVVSNQERPALALAIDRGVATIVRVDRGRVLRLPLATGEGPAQELASGRAYSDVFAAGSRDGADDAVYAWYHRDFTTGRYVYAWSTGGETRMLLDAPQVLELQLAVGPEGPEAWVTYGGLRGSRVEVHAWADGEGAAPVERIRSELGIAGLAVAYDRSGGRHLAYLEGFTEATEFGVNADWTAVYVAPGAQGRPVPLGAAAAPPGRVVVAPDDPLVVWTTGDGLVVASSPGGDGVSLGPGRPVAVTPERLLRFDGATVAAHPLPPGRGAVNVAWSPLAIERAFAARDAQGVTHLVWSGRRVGSGYAVLTSDDRRPLERTVSDRVAATFGWTPWSWPEEAVGQAAGAVLTGIAVTMLLVPVFWLLAAAAAGRVRHERARMVGALTACAVLAVALAAIALVTTVPAQRVQALTGLPWAAPVAIAVGLAAGTLGLRRVDLETLQALVLGATVTSFVSVTLLAYATFQHWLAFLGM